MLLHGCAFPNSGNDIRANHLDPVLAAVDLYSAFEDKSEALYERYLYEEGAPLIVS